MKVVNIDGTTYLKMLVYGDSGSGKTTFLGSAMLSKETAPLLILNARGQPVSLRHLKQRPLVLEIESIKDFNTVYTWLYNGQDMVQLKRLDQTLYAIVEKYLGGYSATKFKSVAVDSITHVQRLAMEQIVGGTMPNNPADIPTQTQIQHWGRTLALMTNFADRFFRLPLHVFMTALTRRDEVPSLGYTLFCPFLWGQSNMEIPSHAEIVGRLMCTGSVSMKQQRDITTAATQSGHTVPFNVMYLKGGRDFVAKWQGVIGPPPIMAEPTASKFMRYYVTET